MRTEDLHPGAKERQVKPEPPPAPPATPIDLLRAVTDAVRQQMKLLADEFDAAPRQGADRDEPEGARYITFSDTLAKQIASQLRQIAAPENRMVTPGELERR